jgi:NAD+ synthase
MATTHAVKYAGILRLDSGLESARIVARIRDIVWKELKRKGAVVGVSGGIDSAVVAYLCARALGADRVLALFTPETDSSPDSLRLGRMVARALHVRSELEDVSSILAAARCYERRDTAIREVVPLYGEGYKAKIVLPNLIDEDRYSVFSLVVRSPGGEIQKFRLSASAYLGILAATNCKQRVRKMMEYYYADRLQYAVAGTPNRLEYDLGFFVKNGDGSADLKPIAHLYKSQVYQLAEYLGVPDEIRTRLPTTDTYPLEQTQEEFFFTLPLEQMDLCLYGRDKVIPPAEITALTGLSSEQVERVYGLIDSRRRATAYLHAQPVLFESPGPLLGSQIPSRAAKAAR